MDQDIVQRPLDPAALPALRERAERVLAEAKRCGADAAEVGISLSQGLSVTVRMGAVETLEFHRDRGISVTVWQGRRKGSASSADDSDDSIRETVAAACAIARHTGEDPHAGLPDPSLYATDIPDLELFHPWPLTPEAAIDDAMRCEAAGRCDARIVNSEGASLSTGTTLRWHATSNGFSAGYGGTWHSRSCVLVAEQDGAMQRDYWYEGRRDPAAIPAPEVIGARAAERTLRRLGARRPASGNLPVLFAPEVASGLLGHFVAAISGGNLYRNASFLRDALDSMVFPAWVDVVEHPRLPRGNGSAPFDNDGLPTRDQHFVQGGRLRSYALNVYAGRRLGMASTGNAGGVRNLQISGSGESFEALLKKMDRGILVTEAMGPGVNIVTGDYSRGAAGFMVENGEITHPVEEFTIAGNLRDMFANLAGAGSDVDDRGNIRTGSLLLDSMRIAGS